MAKKSKKYEKDPGTVIFTKQRRAGELLICSRSFYHGTRVNVRIWKLNEDGAYFPTSNGIALRPAELEMLLEAVEAAIDVEDG